MNINRWIQLWKKSHDDIRHCKSLLTTRQVPLGWREAKKPTKTDKKNVKMTYYIQFQWGGTTDKGMPILAFQLYNSQGAGATPDTLPPDEKAAYAKAMLQIAQWEQGDREELPDENFVPKPIPGVSRDQLPLFEGQQEQ